MAKRSTEASHSLTCAKSSGEREAVAFSGTIAIARTPLEAFRQHPAEAVFLNRLISPSVWILRRPGGSPAGGGRT
jgi:hypothetical protein